MDNADHALICVDIFDQPLGSCSKENAHKKGLLHRAFSIFLVDRRQQRMLIQQRAAGKYHSGGLWTNTCCSHPRMGEETATAARRRLLEETGIQCSIHELAPFVYRQTYENGIIEYEYDHVFWGDYQGQEQDWQIDSAEIQAMHWIPWDRLALSLQQEPQRYSAWFLIAAPQVLQYLASLNKK